MGKTIELRTWKTNYRGKLLIVASRFPKRKSCQAEKGFVLSIERLRKMCELDVELSCCDYSDTYYSWIFKKIRN